LSRSASHSITGASLVLGHRSLSISCFLMNRLGAECQRVGVTTVPGFRMPRRSAAACAAVSITGDGPRVGDLYDVAPMEDGHFRPARLASPRGAPVGFAADSLTAGQRAPLNQGAMSLHQSTGEALNLSSLYRPRIAGVLGASIEFLLGKLPPKQSIHPKGCVAVGAGTFSDAPGGCCRGRTGAGPLSQQSTLDK
jgi:hypothetical protein